MKIKLPHIACAVLSLVLAGCSSTPTHVDTGSMSAHTFNFVGNGTMPNANFSENREHMHQMIQEAITKNLAKKGVTRASGGGDVTVAYLVIVGDNASTAAINDYFGYGRDTSGLTDKAHDSYSGSKNPNYFQAGTLIIDIIDSKTYKLLKRTDATRSLLKDATADVRKERIQEAVDAALQSVHFKK